MIGPDKTLIENPREQIVLRTVRAWRIEGRSLAEIAIGLERHGILNRHSRPFAVEGIRTLLQREAADEPPSSPETFAGIVDADGELIQGETDASH
jgi:hypothetical protein